MPQPAPEGVRISADPGVIKKRVEKGEASKNLNPNFRSERPIGATPGVFFAGATHRGKMGGSVGGGLGGHG